MTAKKVIKRFNKYFCPNCDRYLGKSYNDQPPLLKEESCMRCKFLLDWSEPEGIVFKGELVSFPCKVGDKVRLKVTCEHIRSFMDWETGVVNCPFEDDCNFEECNNGNECELITEVIEIFNRGLGWYVHLKDLDIEIPVNDFGKTVFLENGSSQEVNKDDN